MIISNEEIADTLSKIADALEEQEENPYRIRAYRRAANSIKRCSDNIYDLILKKTNITFIPYIGKKLEEVIIKIVNGETNLTPKIKPPLPYPEKLRKKINKNTSYKIYSIHPIIEKIISALKQIPNVKKIEATGDYRRKKETVSNFDIIVIASDIPTLFTLFHELPSIKYIIETTASTTTVQLKIGIQITLRVVKESKWGINLLLFTGSQEHYQALENLAHKKHFNLTENGIINGKTIVSATEIDLYNSLQLEYIHPELRENRGEICAAEKNNLPKLITLNDIKGDLHCHTNETDGYFSLEEMILAAKNQGYQYVAITDHSQSLKITNGMDETRLLKQIEQINEMNSKLSDFKVLKSIEVDILEDGSLDLSNEVLKELDLTVCSVHSKFKLSLKKQTDRIIKAMDNPYFNILGHATGRLIKHRPPYEVDMDRILFAAKERNCHIEVNAQPARLDIHDIYCKRAKEIGVKVAISSDAHTLNGFNFMILGVNQARRGWLEAKDVINTYTLEELKIILKR